MNFTHQLFPLSVIDSLIMTCSHLLLLRFGRMCTCQQLIQFKVAAGLTRYVADVTDSSGSDKLKLDIYWCRCLLERQLDCNLRIVSCCQFSLSWCISVGCYGTSYSCHVVHSWSLQPQNEKWQLIKLMSSGEVTEHFQSG